MNGGTKVFISAIPHYVLEKKMIDIDQGQLIVLL